MARERKAQSSNGDGNIQIAGNGNTVSVQSQPHASQSADAMILGLTRRQLNWTIVGILVTIAIFVMTYFDPLGVSLRHRNDAPVAGGSGKSKSPSMETLAVPNQAGEKMDVKQKASSVPGEQGKDRRTPGDQSVLQPREGNDLKPQSSKETTAGASQKAHGDKNVQIVGEGNTVDNRTYITVAANAQLTYQFSNLQRRADGRYETLLTISSTGSSVVYKPVIRLDFDRSIESVEASTMTGGVFVNERQVYNADKTSYTYSVNEMPPGMIMRYTIICSTEFSITRFRINDTTII